MGTVLIAAASRGNWSGHGTAGCSIRILFPSSTKSYRGLAHEIKNLTHQALVVQADVSKYGWGKTNVRKDILGDRYPCQHGQKCWWP